MMVIGMFAKPAKMNTMQVAIAMENAATWITAIFALMTKMNAQRALADMD